MSILTTGWVFRVVLVFARPVNGDGSELSELIDQRSLRDVPWHSPEKHLATVAGVFVVLRRQLTHPSTRRFTVGCKTVEVNYSLPNFHVDH